MTESIGALIARLAETNVELWHEEDKARVQEPSGGRREAGH